LRATIYGDINQPASPLDRAASAADRERPAAARLAARVVDDIMQLIDAQSSSL
jgi:hypothetical protein